MRMAITKGWGPRILLSGQIELGDKTRGLVAKMAAINTLTIECEGGNEFHG
jgi:hypothetical protein